MIGLDFTTPPPETLYKYTSFKRALSILVAGEIYFANPREFNDPFDGRFSADLECREEREKLLNFMEKERILPRVYESHFFSLWKKWEREKQEFMSNPHAYAKEMSRKWAAADSRGFCCLTESSESLLMWAHYADNHTGCCLAFDLSKYCMGDEAVFPFSLLQKIEYRDKLPMVSAGNVPFFYGFKFREWEYEKEWRACMIDATENKNIPPDSWVRRKVRGAGVYKLNETLLRGVILGYQMEECDKEKIVEIARQRGIAVYQAKPELYEYGMQIIPVCGKG